MEKIWDFYLEKFMQFVLEVAIFMFQKLQGSQASVTIKPK